MALKILSQAFRPVLHQVQRTGGGLFSVRHAS